MEYTATADDQPLVKVTRNLSGGMNSRDHGSNIGETQATVLYNIDIGTPGQTTKRPGLTLVEDLGSNAGTALYGFEPQGGTNQLVGMYTTNLLTWPGSGTFTNRKSNFTSTARPCVFRARESSNGDVVMVGNGTDNWFRMTQAYAFADLGNTNTSPPISNVGTYYRSRMWVLKGEKLYYSDAVSSDYSAGFDRTSNNYNMPVGAEQAIVGLRDLGLICFGLKGIYAINPSATPAATDKTEVLYDKGCMAGNTVAQVGDDIYFLAPDGVRSLVRTQQDKVQLGASFPVSYPLKDEFANISWGYIDKACATYFDNKYFISLPTSASSYNNQVWVYWPATNAWAVITGWNVSAWAKLKVNGQEKLYCTDSNDGSVYQAWYGYSDNGTAINYQEEGRKEDMGQPLLQKFGGYFKVKAFSAGSYTLTVSASIDDQDYVTLGTIDLSGSAPTLPVTLPFTLAGTNIISTTFPLDSLGEWNQIRFKIQHNALNGSDEIKILERSLYTYAGEYTP